MQLGWAGAIRPVFPLPKRPLGRFFRFCVSEIPSDIALNQRTEAGTIFTYSHVLGQDT